jgi:hypothetical protein
LNVHYHHQNAGYAEAAGQPGCVQAIVIRRRND